MDKLPNEMLLEIFKRLDVNSLVRCRQVCKRWLTWCKTIRITHLAVAEDLCSVGNFFHSEKPIKQCNLFLTRKNAFYKSKMMKNLLFKVKVLYIKNAPAPQRSSFNCSALFNELSQIEVLEIDYLKIRRWDMIQSTNLKVLSIWHCNNSRIRLETPNLIGLRTCHRLSFFEFVSSRKSVERLSVSSFSVSDVLRFENLVYLKCDNGISNGSDILNSLTKLQELHCSYISAENVNNLLKQQKVLRRIDFNFYFRGINIATVDDVARFVEKSDEVRQFLIENFDSNRYNLSKTVSFLDDCNYSELIKSNPRVNDKFFRKFFSKFNNISRVTVRLRDTELLDLDLFSKFIECCTYVDYLALSNVALGQKFYDNLEKLCPYLSHLEIIDKDVHIRTDFVFNHNLLKSFSINQQMSLEEIEKLFEHRQFNSLTYKIQNKNIEIMVDHELRNSNCLTIDANQAVFHNKKSMFKFLEDVLYSNLRFNLIDQF